MTRGTNIIRASSLSSYLDCPGRAAARIFRGELKAAGFELSDPPASIGAAVGSAVHAGAAVALNEKAKTGSLPPVDVATDAARDSLREQIEKGVQYDRETPVADIATIQAVRMTRAYHDGIAPAVQPIIVEERLEANAGPHLVLSGQADVVAREPGRIRDLKTGKTRGNHKPQIGAYALLARTHGLDIQQASEDFVRRVAVSKPQPEPEVYLHDVGACEAAAIAVLHRIAGDLKTFREGDPAKRMVPGDPWAFPKNPSSNLCSARWCPAWGGKGNNAFCEEWKSNEKEGDQ